MEMSKNLKFFIAFVVTLLGAIPFAESNLVDYYCGVYYWSG
jgi:hypothetical protein